MIDMSPLRDVPRMSTDYIGAFINDRVSELKADQCYLNVGVWHGYSLLAGMIGNDEKRCIGVDNFSEFGGPSLEFMERFQSWRGERHSFFRGDCETYFREVHKRTREPIGLFYYDADHGAAATFKALKAAHEYMAPGGLMMVDDTNWDAPRQAMDLYRTWAAGDAQLVLDIQTEANITPWFWNGLMVVRVR